MHGSKFWISAIAAAAALACGGETPLDPDDGGGTPVVVELDMYQPSGGTASATGPMLAVGQTAHIKVEGTYSIWGEAMWENGVCEGNSEATPAFPSAGGNNGAVGIDAEFYFAVPSGSALCDNPYPWGAGEFKLSLDGGADFDNPDPIVPLSGPTPGHVYEYDVVGQGHPIMFQREDSPSSDNYGVLRITITPE